MAPLTEKTCALIAGLEEIAKALESTVARIALAWGRMRPGVTSMISGACRVSQLEEKLKPTEIMLSADELSLFDAVASWRRTS